MFTVCPKCTLTLSVTAGDLRTGQGYVRCGRCSNVFNALLTLTEQPPEAAPAAAAPATAPADPTSAQTTKVAAAPTSEAAPATEVASSIQIDRILMLGGSAFPRPQPASVPRAPAPAPQRRASPAPSAPATRAPRADSTEAPARASPAARAPATPAKPPAAVPPTAASPAEVRAPADRADANHPLPPARRPRDPRAPVPSRPAFAPSPEAAPVIPPKRLPPAVQATEEPEEPPADEAELVERSGNHKVIEGHTVETIVLEGDGFTQTEEFVSEEQAGLAALRREIESLGEERGGAAAGPRVRAAESAADSGAVMRRVRSFRLPRRGSPKAETSDLGQDGDRSTPPAEAATEIPFALDAHSQRYRWAWLSGSIALALLLAVQGIDHWRDALAASPNVGSMVTRTYAALGVTLEPHWDLAAYEVRQQGAESDPKDAHVIHVRLSLANHAARAQPVPVLRLTLLDRYGKHIAQRDLAPDEYWPRGHARQSFLGADQRIDSEVAVRDPNADSASFELDVCLRGQARLRCAMDGAPATANLLTP